jgi:hypothetical protein
LAETKLDALSDYHGKKLNCLRQDSTIYDSDIQIVSNGLSASDPNGSPLKRSSPDASGTTSVHESPKAGQSKPTSRLPSLPKTVKKSKRPKLASYKKIFHNVLNGE